MNNIHTDKECDTSVVLLVYGPCMVVVVSGMVTSSPSAMILWACMQNFMIQWENRHKCLLACREGINHWGKINLEKTAVVK